MRITPITMPTNSGLSVGIVPTLAGTGCCLASEPARPRANTIGANRASSMAMPPVTLYQVGFVVRAAHAEPLLLAIDVEASTISVRPCAPGIRTASRGTLTASDRPANTSTTVGVVRMYSAAYFISVGLIFLPMYSGVRPTIRPPMNTVMTARMRMPYRPAPTPPGTTSPIIMLNSATPPPNGVYESWNEFTAPVEVTVVDAANSDDPGMPKTTFLPSIAAPAACAATPDPWCSKKLTSAADAAHRITITERIAYPWRFSFTIVPNVRVRANGITRIRKISKMLVNGFGFSNGWAELA